MKNKIYQPAKNQICDAAYKPREKLDSQGISNLNNCELLALIIGSGTKNKDVFSLAREINEYIGNDIGNLAFDSLKNLSGLGPIRAGKIAAAVELVKRLASTANNKILSSKDINLLSDDIRHKNQEHFVLITLNSAGCLIAKHLVFIGTINQSIVSAREIFSLALKDCAASMILVHNHPSGNLTPSKEDIQVTKQLIKGANILNLNIVDHIIVSKNGYYSFYEEGIL